MVQKTPIYKQHCQSGAKMVEFAGWMLPVEYDGLRLESLRVRKTGGLFDVSHMGQIRVQGDGALEALKWLIPTQLECLDKHKACYTVLLNESAGVVDDVVIYCFQKNTDYLLCVNASQITKDFQWLKKHIHGNVELSDESEGWAQIAVQGPRSYDLLKAFDTFPMNPFCIQDFSFDDVSGFFASTGYTGEAGGEIFIPSHKACDLWERLVKRGREWDIHPVGLGARDVLRIEKGYPLYGQELSEERHVLECRLSWLASSKQDFLGRTGMTSFQKEHKLIGFALLDAGIPRTGYLVFDSQKQKIGEVTSGTYSASLNKAIGLAFVKTSLGANEEIFIKVRQKKLRAVQEKLPFL